MKIITKKYQTYEFNELSKDTQNEVINNFINFFIGEGISSIGYDNLSENVKKAIDASEKMQTPWFLGTYLHEYANDEIMENVQNKVYLVDGSIFNE